MDLGSAWTVKNQCSVLGRSNVKNRELVIPQPLHLQCDGWVRSSIYAGDVECFDKTRYSAVIVLLAISGDILPCAMSWASVPPIIEILPYEIA